MLFYYFAVRTKSVVNAEQTTIKKRYKNEILKGYIYIFFYTNYNQLMDQKKMITIVLIGHPLNLQTPQKTTHNCKLIQSFFLLYLRSTIKIYHPI